VVDNFPVPPDRHLKISVEAPGYEIYEGNVPDIAVSQPPPIQLVPSHTPVSSPPPVDVAGKKVNGIARCGGEAGDDCGKVLGQGKSAVEEAEVLVESGTAQRRVLRDSNGTFRVLDVTAGTDTQITVRARGYKLKVLDLSPEDVKHMTAGWG